MDSVERDVIHGIHQRLIFCVWGLIPAVTFERKVIPATNVRGLRFLVGEKSHVLSLSSTYLCKRHIKHEKSPHGRDVLYGHAAFDAADGKATT